DQLDPAYLKLNPNGVVPTLVHDGNVIVESTVIMHYLDDTFPTPPLMPRHPLDRARAHLFTKLMDEYIHPACIVFTFATANRGPLGRLSKEQRDAQLAKAPLQRQSEYKRAGVEEGLNSPMGKEATKSFEKLLKWIQESSERGPWLAGPDFSLADIAATPYMTRLEMLKLSRMWNNKRGVAEWWERVKARPSHDSAITKWLRREDMARYEKLADPWVEVSKNISHWLRKRSGDAARRETNDLRCSTRRPRCPSRRQAM
ncbi:MAG: glutathione S-transferase family protein, partial [Deltaproteobacteria bacterium]|nr:glutathione S-transferase family protein [Deltaproteobacteria bacterium]